MPVRNIFSLIFGAGALSSGNDNIPFPSILENKRSEVASSAAALEENVFKCWSVVFDNGSTKAIKSALTNDVALKKGQHVCEHDMSEEARRVVDCVFSSDRKGSDDDEDVNKILKVTKGFLLNNCYFLEGTHQYKAMLQNVDEQLEVALKNMDSFNAEPTHVIYQFKNYLKELENWRGDLQAIVSDMRQLDKLVSGEEPSKLKLENQIKNHKKRMQQEQEKVERKVQQLLEMVTAARDDQSKRDYLKRLDFIWRITVCMHLVVLFFYIM